MLRWVGWTFTAALTSMEIGGITVVISASSSFRQRDCCESERQLFSLVESHFTFGLECEATHHRWTQSRDCLAREDNLIYGEVVAIEDLAARTHVLSGGDTHDRVITVRCLATRGRAGGVGSDGHDAECLFEERAGALDRVGDFRERMLLHYSELEVSSEGHKEFYTIGHGDHGTLLGRGGDACDMRRRVLCVSGAGLILIDSGVGHTASTFFNVLVHFVELQFFLIVLFWVNKSDFGILKVLWGNFVGFDGFWWGLCGDMGGCDVKCIKICRIDYCKGVSKNEREWRRDYEGGGILMGGNGKGVVRLYLEGVSGAECGLIMSGGVWGVVGRYRDIGKKGMRDLDRGGMEWLGKWMDVRGCVYKRGDGSGEYWWWVPIHCKETSIRRRL
ncbi:hypothetical protein Tco_1391628 [Tanacetum coccineum]|uniref:Uncharacterized protein n=1 Tax=Tanacetum coccineum TaxID=301880 RepID=A0ABQ4WTV0_9ASTR